MRMRTVTVIKRMKRRRSGGRSRKFVKKVFSSSTTMFVSSSLWSQMNSDVFQTWTLTAVLCCRSPGAQRLRGGEARRAGGDAGRSRVAAGHEQLSVRSAGTSVRPPTDRKSSGVTAACVSLTCPLWRVPSVCRSRVSYFAVFDGHGGARASRFAAENLHHNLAKKFPSGEFKGTVCVMLCRFTAHVHVYSTFHIPVCFTWHLSLLWLCYSLWCYCDPDHVRYQNLLWV